MSPAEFRERIAHYNVDPWGDDWDIGATVAKAIQDATYTMVAFWTKQDIPSAKWPRLFDFIPMPDWLRRKRVKQWRKARAGNGRHR